MSTAVATCGEPGSPGNAIDLTKNGADPDTSAEVPHDEDDMDEDVEEEEHEWDEGGPSHCGYSESVHNTLFSVGESVHKVVGEPSEGVQSHLAAVGNWFQEASYAARDLLSGNKDHSASMSQDTMEVVSTIMKSVQQETAGANDEKKEEVENK